MVKLLLPIIFIIALLCIGGVVILEMDANMPQTAAPEVLPQFNDRLVYIGGEYGGFQPLTPYKLQSDDNITYQVFDSFIMAYNPAAPEDAQVYYVSIGQYFKLENMPSTYRVADPGPQAKLRYYNDVAIWTDAYAIMDKFPNLLGKPLTPLLYNTTTAKLEQYFENAGLTRDANGGPKDLKFLPYGLWFLAFGPNQTGLSRQDIRDATSKAPQIGRAHV